MHSCISPKEVILSVWQCTIESENGRNRRKMLENLQGKGFSNSFPTWPETLQMYEVPQEEAKQSLSKEIPVKKKRGSNTSFPALCTLASNSDITLEQRKVVSLLSKRIEILLMKAYLPDLQSDDKELTSRVLGKVQIHFRTQMPHLSKELMLPALSSKHHILGNKISHTLKCFQNMK